MMQSQRPIGIVGGLGKTGRRVAERLTASGAAFRVLSRSTAPSFDWERPKSWPPALTGVGAAYVTFQPDLALPGAADLIGELAKVAMSEGVERIVLLSGRGEPGARLAEETLAAAGIDWAVIGSSWFAQNFSESFLAGAVAQGMLVVPTGTAPEPFVDAEDIADVAAAVLTGRAPSGRVYEVTGPTALRFPQACAILEEETGRPLECREVSPDAFAIHLREAGVPDQVVPMLIDLFTTTLDGRNSAPANGVAEALGRPPVPFERYAARLRSREPA